MKKKAAFFYALAILLLSLPLLGAKGCNAGEKNEVLPNLPELNEIAGKFEIEETENGYTLTTFDNLTFKEAVDLLRNKTEVNIPVSFYGTDWGLYKSLTQPYEGIEPYKGVIYLRDGWWRAIEYAAAVSDGSVDLNRPVAVTEYAYCNDTVYELNQFSHYNEVFYYVLSLLDNGEGNFKKIQGDGSTDEMIIMEFGR